MESGFGSEESREERSGEIDIRALWAILVRKRAFILIPTCAAFFLTWLIVSLVTPRYTAESQVLLENQENFFTRPQKDQAQADNTILIDPEAVNSGLQLITSRDLARRAIKVLDLEGNPEFDPLAKGIGPLSRVLILLGVARDPTRLSPEERMLEAFQERLAAFSPTKTRVITIDFTSRDPELAARAANKVAELYLKEQADAKRARAKAAAASLQTLTTELRGKLAEASAKVEEFRSSSGLLAGTNNMTITGQQLAELNTELSKARTSQADAQAKASFIRDMIKKGRISDIPDVANNDLVRRIAEQRVSVRALLASELRTLLPGHPRIKELNAQVAELDSALRAAGEQTEHALENEARIAGDRVTNLESVLSQQKKTAGVANTDEVHLHELERIADAYKDQLEGSTTKYQEALAQEDSSATPSDARIISRAVVPHDPSYPKKIPLIVFATLATFLGTSGWITAGELLSGRVMVGKDRIPRAATEAASGGPVFSRAMAVEPRVDMPSLDPPDAPEVRSDAIALSAAAFAAQIAGKQKEGDGMCIVTTGLTRADVASGVEIAIGRQLAQDGHAIILDLDGHPANFDPLFASWSEDGHPNEDLLGLTDLLCGKASFAEVIRRDDASRLHFISAGRHESFDFGDFDLVLEALAQTYDFILLMTPPLERNDMAKLLAAQVDAVLVSAPPDASETVAKIKAELIGAGAKEVIVVDAVPADLEHEHLDVA
ncbi:GumC family protein [Methyloferula stellata]|uniref:GumC family protein n=1 Tax=Methyloferula stellata TaxID=876270 RepID=UPI0003652A92|nr:exopolysaccharide transport family protein [Methyloferula stellata]